MNLTPLFFLIGALAVSFPETASYVAMAWALLLILRQR